MKPSQFWQSIRLSEELGISGRFIYNGLRSLHEMETLYQDDEIFEMLYNLSVGLERLMKIAVVLIEHDDAVDQEQFEKDLITHNHLDLMSRIRKVHPLKLGTAHNELLGLLGKFYKSYRYGRYSMAAMKANGKEKAELHKYIEKYLDIEIRDNFPIDISPNSERIRKFVGTKILKIARSVYEVIGTEADKKNVYTYEVRQGSKAAKVFLDDEWSFAGEDHLCKELVLFLVKSKVRTGHLGLLHSLEPLDFDPALICDYLQCLTSDEKKLEVLSEMESLQADLPDIHDRRQLLDVIGNSSVFFDDEEE